MVSSVFYNFFQHFLKPRYNLDEDIKKDYNKYRNTEDFDATVLNTAKDFVPGYRNTGRRTKQQWLDIARMVGSNLNAKTSEDLKKYAMQSWNLARPNQAANLNRQSAGFVDFKIHEWVDEVYKGAGVGAISENVQPQNLNKQPGVEKLNAIENTLWIEYNNGEEVYIDSKREYAKAISAIHEDMSNNLDYTGFGYANTNEHYYVYNNSGFSNKPVIVMKIPINEENDSLIDSIKEVIKYEVNGNSNSIDTIVETLKTGGETNNSDNISSPGRESNVENDRLYRQTQGSEPTGNNRTNVRTGEKIQEITELMLELAKK